MGEKEKYMHLEGASELELLLKHPFPHGQWKKRDRDTHLPGGKKEN